MNQILLKLSREMYKAKHIESRLKETTQNATELWKNFSDVAEIVRSQLTWIGAHSTFWVSIPQKNSGSIKMELAILNFGSKSSVRLNTAIDKTLEMRNEFYKRMCSIHNKCQVSVDTHVHDFPARD